MDEKNLNQDNIDTPVIPDDVILDDVIKDEEPTPPVEEKNVKLIPPYIFAIIVGVLSIIIAISVLVIQYKQNPKCVEHLDGDGDRLCDFCNLVIDNVNVPPHTHYYVEGVCQCGFVDVNYVAPPKTDYTSNVNNAAELFNDIFYGSYTKLDNNATLINLDISGSLASVLFAEGTPDTILLDTNKIFMNINKLGIRTQKSLWITDAGQYTAVLTNNEIAATWQPKSLGVSQTFDTVLVTGDDITYNIETGYFEVSREYLNQLQGNIMSPAFYILNQVPGLEDMDYGELEYLVKFKINEVNELTDFEIKGLADTKDVVSVVYSRQESRYQFSMVVRHGVLFQFNIVYSPQGANDNFLFNIVIEPAVDMYINAMDLSMKAHLTLGNAEVDFDDVTLKAMEEARKTYENADKPHEHDYITNRDEPTCTASGYIIYDCECGDIYVDTLPALGHDYVNGVCTRCNHTQNKVETTGFATFNSIVAEDCTCSFLHSCLTPISPVTLTWDELMLPENGQKYGYDAEAITDQSVGYCAFEGCGTLISISMPDSVTVMDTGVFNNCTNLTTVKLSDNITKIYDRMFMSCTSLKNITIPDNVVFIGESAFINCSKLTNIQVGEQVCFIGQDAFKTTGYYNDSANWENNVLYLKNYLLAARYASDVVIDNNITVIADAAFSGCRNLTSISIPDTVTHIGSYAFEECRMLQSINIGANVVYMGEGLFKDCVSLTDVNIDTNNKHYQCLNDVLYNYDLSCLLWYSPNKTDESFVIPDTVNTIEDYAFYECKLVSLTIPTSIKRIKEGAFEECNLENVFIYDLVSWCNIVLDSYHSQPVQGSCNVYVDGVPISSTLIIPNGITHINNFAFNDFPVTHVIIPEGVVSIGNYAFSSYSITNVELPESLRTIGHSAFAGTCLKSIALPSGLIDVDNSVFLYCDLQFNEYENCKYLGSKDNPYFILMEAINPDLSEYTIHADTKIIAGSAFESCHAITSIVIPDGVVGIGSRAFDCSNLKSVFMPNSIVSIGEWTFYSLTYSDFEIYYNGTQREWNNINIGDHNSALKDVQIHYQK